MDALIASVCNQPGAAATDRFPQHRAACCTKDPWSCPPPQLPDTATQFSTQQSPQGDPIRVPNLRGNLVDTRVPGAQEMDCLLDAQVLEVREWRLSQHAL